MNFNFSVRNRHQRLRSKKILFATVINGRELEKFYSQPLMTVTNKKFQLMTNKDRYEPKYLFEEDNNGKKGLCFHFCRRASKKGEMEI